MDAKALFDLWAPPASVWSPWAKAAPFAQLPVSPEATDPALPPISPLPRDVPVGGEMNCAIVVHAPGAACIALGLALAAQGYRPVPLFNACSPQAGERLGLPVLAVDTDAISAGLVQAAGALAVVGPLLPARAPPAFLVDALRCTPRVAIQPEVFDNRSVVFASDFPSADFLRAQGLSRALLLHETTLAMGRDLLTALHPWKQGGLPVDALGLDASPLSVAWPRSGFLGEWRERCFALLSLRRAAGGGFGGFVPESSGG